MTEQKPMSTTSAAAPAADDATAGQKAYDEAVKQMTDRNLYDRVRAFHPHGNASPETAKAMLDDYNRLKAEADKAAADAEAAEREASAKAEGGKPA